ncbi:MAG: alpha/beta hydrolase [Verrucomicrobia bacterium]|nr:alpha/beta hydrolase [Verrucomicrobiota bacterium]
MATAQGPSSGGECLQIRIHGDASLPTLVYLPGLHGDWTLVTSFRIALAGRVRFVEITYPRTLEWSLEDYAHAISAALMEKGISTGWLLGESFGSQIIWPMLGRTKEEVRSASELAAHDVSPLAPRPSHFAPQGIVLAGGFVRHPLPWGVRLAARLTRGVSLTWLTRLLFWYARFARFRHRHAPETLASIAEFVARRTERDKQAAVHRLKLIVENDPRLVAAGTRLPVYHLTGFFDPIVPWPLVRPWLRRHCPGWRGGKIIWSADHNVLGTAPRAAADTVAGWMNAGVSGNAKRA